MARCDSYVRGQCTWGACFAYPWVPEWLGKARDWLTQAARDGLPISNRIPVVGSVAVFRPGEFYSELGHVGCVTHIPDAHHVTVVEMNYVAEGRYDERVAKQSDVEGYILAPGTPVPDLITPTLPPIPQDLGQTWALLQDWWNAQVERDAGAGWTVRTLFERLHYG